MRATNQNDLCVDDGRACHALAEAVQRSISVLTTPFVGARNAEALSMLMAAAEFLKKFLESADQFSDTCCGECAEIMRQCAQAQDVRRRSAASLAGGIRRKFFRRLDRRVQALKQLSKTRDYATTIMRESSLSDDRRTQGVLLFKQCDAVIVQAVSEYMEIVKSLAERVLNYCCGKCCGNLEHNERQSEALEVVQTMIARELEPVIRLMLALSGPKPENQQEGAEKPWAIKGASWKNDLSSPRLWIKFSKGFGLAVLIIIIVGILVSLFLPRE